MVLNVSILPILKSAPEYTTSGQITNTASRSNSTLARYAASRIAFALHAYSALRSGLHSELYRALRLAVLCALSCLLLLSCSKPPPTFYDIQGDPHTVMPEHTAPHPPPWLLINYWASWCKPCRTEIPELNQLALSKPELLRIWAVNYDALHGDELIAQAQALNIQFTVLQQDPGPSLGLKRPSALPTSFIINPKGELHRVLQGPQTAEQLLKALKY